MIAKSIVITLLFVVVFVNVEAEWNKFACYDVGFEIGAGTTDNDKDYHELCSDQGNAKAYLDGIRDAWDSKPNPQSELELELKQRDIITPPETMETVTPPGG